MEKNSSSSSSSSKQSSFSSSSSSSSSIAELFGPKDSVPLSSYSHSSSSGSSSSIFGSVFGPSSMGGVRDPSSQVGNYRHTVPENWSQNSKEENGKSSYYQQETIDQPCNFSSSIYYGGQEVYSPTTHPNDSHSTFKKDEQDDDPNSASRGNWWQGSFYY